VYAHDDGHEDEGLHKVSEDQSPVGQVVVDVVLQLVREPEHPLLGLAQRVRHQSGGHEEQERGAEDHAQAEGQVLVELHNRLGQVAPARVDDGGGGVEQVRQAVHGAARGARGVELVREGPCQVGGQRAQGLGLLELVPELRGAGGQHVVQVQRFLTDAELRQHLQDERGHHDGLLVAHAVLLVDQ